MTTKSNNWTNENYWSQPTQTWNTNFSNPFKLPTINNGGSLMTNPFTTKEWLSFYNTNSNTQNNQPSVNSYETNDSYVLEFAVPGYDKESFEVSYNENTLTVKSTYNNERKENYTTKEFTSSPFTREFQLPSNVDTSDIKAKYNNGILTVSVSKTTNSSKRKSVKIS
jgi:HSP20 family protein